VRIGVLSDTHVPEAGPDLPPQAYEALAGSDLILHCGDLHSLEVLDRLERFAPVIAARGNGDTLLPWHRRPGVPEDPRVSETHLLELEGFQIGITHDLETVDGRPEDYAEDLIQRVFGQRVDIALCGHTHVPLGWGLSSGTAILNPGSPTMPYGYTKVVGTIGLLNLERGTFDFQVLDLASGDIQVHIAGPGPAPLQKGPRPKHV
jgi:putative phosphoesterase